MNSSPPAATGAKRWFPALAWLRSYEPRSFRGDFVAAITLAAYLLPSGLGDASLANLTPEAGLYACLFSGLVFWIFCSSRQTAITVTSAIFVLIGASMGEIAGGDKTRFGALASATALLVALIAFMAWLVKAGAIVNFISESMMTGFKCPGGVRLQCVEARSSVRDCLRAEGVDARLGGVNRFTSLADAVENSAKGNLVA